MITYKQLSLADIFSDCQNEFDNNKIVKIVFRWNSGFTHL